MDRLTFLQSKLQEMGDELDEIGITVFLFYCIIYNLGKLFTKKVTADFAFISNLTAPKYKSVPFRLALFLFHPLSFFLKIILIFLI